MHLCGEGQYMTRGKGGCTTGIINDSVETMRDESDDFLSIPSENINTMRLDQLGLL